MKLKHTHSTKEATFLVLPIFQQKNYSLPQELDEFQPLVDKLFSLGDFYGKKATTQLLYGKKNIKRLFLIGLGKKTDVTVETMREISGSIGKKMVSLKERDVTLVLSPLLKPANDFARGFVEGLLLGSYSFDKFKLKKTKKEKKEYKINSITVLTAQNITQGLKEGLCLAESVNEVRDLCNQPGNHLTPRIFAERAKKMAKLTGLSCNVLNEKEMKEEKMGSLLSVSQGSEEEARLIVLEHKPEKIQSKKTIVFVGKGLTFDAGGISLKPARNMHEMKRDMSGGAAVYGALKAIAEMKLPIYVIGIIPSSENLINGKATKPGDVVTAKNGTTIEVLNTDAEGRLILADALTYAEKYKPDYVIDIATLTGAITVALGDVVTGMMGTNQPLMDMLKQAGEETYDRVWQLPMFEEFEQQLDSPVADIANIGGPLAGSITAAKFLSHFTKSFCWTHLDIAGTAMLGSQKKTYLPKGSSGVGVRLFYQFVKNIIS